MGRLNRYFSKRKKAAELVFGIVTLELVVVVMVTQLVAIKFVFCCT